MENNVLDSLRIHSSDNLGEGEAEETIAKAEAKLNIRFPDSYRRFLLEIGYAEIYGDEIYSIYDESDNIACLGVVQQNIKSQNLKKGFLEVLSTDVDGVFFIKIEDGSIYLNDLQNRTADSFEDLITSLLAE